MSQETLALFARLLFIFAEMPPEAFPSFEAYENKWFQRLENDGIDPIQARIIQLAIDGLWFSEILEMGVPTEEKRAQIVESLLQMASSVSKTD